MKNEIGNKEYRSYKGWKAACNKVVLPNGYALSFYGDKDIGGCFAYDLGEGKIWIGEWDGAIGEVVAKVTIP